MSGYFAAGRLSDDEKNDILKLHTSIYDGYRTMQPEVKKEQPLYVYDPAQDKVGAVVNNKGEVKAYTNVGINEQVSEQTSKNECKECGGMMSEGECTECGWKGEVGDMEEGKLEDLGNKAKDWMNKPFSPDIEDYIQRVLDIIDNPEKKDDDEDEHEEKHKKHAHVDEDDSEEPSFMDKAWDTAKDVGMFVAANPEILAALEEEDADEEVCECGGMMREGECSECGYKMGDLDENTGHLDDIYHEEDLNPSDEFDYVKGASNKTNAFHVKEQAEDYINYTDNEDDDDYEDPDNEDDGFEDLQAGEELDEQGGNAPDFDISSVNGAYNFKTKGPKSGDGPYDEEADDMDLDDEEVGEPYNFSTGGPGIGAAYPVYEDTDEECDECYEQMESAWSEDMDEQDVSGAQGIYGDMEPAYDFDSEGPGKAGPYQHNQYTEGETDEQYLPKHAWNKMKRRQDAEKSGEDFDADELDITDYEDDFDPKNSSWEDITDLVGSDEFSHVDEDIRESLVIQKNRIMEMMNRMKVIK